ncbi:MAG TPA: AAA family ATPase [Saprospiraceae bacterium]|nr:AAA family ATPase [Saprospiraceae bacterium]
MRIKKLSISNFRHFENLEFDFTYQTGERKGQSLDKICIIGQSATGKTSILEFLKWKIGINQLETESFDNNSQVDSGKLIYFSAEILSKQSFQPFELSIGVDPANISNPNIPTLTQQQQQHKKNLLQQQQMQNVFTKKVLEFNESTNQVIWNFLFQEIKSYRSKLTQKGSDLINKGFHANYQILEREMEHWKRENPNPLINLAENCLNPILKRLNLEVDIVNTSSPIPLKAINIEKAIPANALSTGTKQLMLNAIPLFKLDTEQSIIMMDEPERSLFPDIQIELMNYYQKLAPKAQFIVATHSPFIAAAFEEDERFILYFDENGKVCLKRGISPIGDDPNDILKNDFGLDSLMNSFGVNAYKKYLGLKESLRSEENNDRKKEILLELTKLGEKYKF